MVVVVCLFAALLARLAFLQAGAKRATTALASQGVVTVYTPAPRGSIYDRSGHLLVGTAEVPVIEITRQAAQANPHTISALADLASTPASKLWAVVDSSQYAPLAAIPVLSQVTPAEYLQVEQHPRLFAGALPATEPEPRYTAMGIAAANVVGYVAPVTAAEYKVEGGAKSGGKITQTSLVGQAGIEATQNTILQGTPGVERIAVDPSGRALRVLSYTPPIPGRSIRLTISGRLQEAAVAALAAAHSQASQMIYPAKGTHYPARSGAMVVEDPTNGTILALATMPDYNPTVFQTPLSQSAYQQMFGPAAGSPMIDRAIQGEYNPGSTFKLVTATAGLWHGIITPTSYFNDVGGGLLIDGHFFANDAHQSWGLVNLAKAITVSDDAYFYNIGITLWNQRATLGPNALQNVGYSYGFGSPTGIGLPGESSGYVLTPAMKAKIHKLYPKAYPFGTWYPGDNVQTAIGQDDVVVTPLQLANAYSTLADGGTVWVPRLVGAVLGRGGQVISAPATKVARRIPLTASQRSAMIAGFQGVTHSPVGTGSGTFASFPMDVAGKTGTAQVTGSPPTAVFTSFAPANNPHYVVDCFMAKAGYGASACAPAVRMVYDSIYKIPGSPTWVGPGGVVTKLTPATPAG